MAVVPSAAGESGSEAVAGDEAAPWGGDGWAGEPGYGAYEDYYGGGGAEGFDGTGEGWGGGGGYYGEDGQWYEGDGGEAAAGYYDEDGNWIEGYGADATEEKPIDTLAPMDYGSGLKRTEDDTRTPDQRRIEMVDATADKFMAMYGQKTLTATQKEEQTKWIREAEARLADPYRRPVRMATAPKDHIAMAVEAERAREAVALQFSKKAQYYDKMKLKDEEFAFKDEEGMPTVEIVGDFTPTVRLLAIDTAEILRLRDAFRKFKGKKELGVSVGDLARVGHAEFDFEPLADTWYSKVGQHGKVRLGFKLFVEFMVRFCCVPKDRMIRYVYRAFDTSGLGSFSLTDMGRMVKALHPNYGRGPFEKMMEVCLSVCKMTKYDKKKTCSLEEFLLLPRATTSLFYPIFVWLDELKLACMGPEWWEHAYKRITQLDATLLTVGIANETVLLKEDGEPVGKPKGDIVARKRAQARGQKAKASAAKK